MTRKILVTGMTGLIESAVRKQLEGKYQLSAFNHRQLESVECQVDVSDFNATLPAFRGQDVVVYLAATWRGIHRGE